MCQGRAIRRVMPVMTVVLSNQPERVQPELGKDSARGATAGANASLVEFKRDPRR